MKNMKQFSIKNLRLIAAFVLAQIMLLFLIGCTQKSIAPLLILDAEIKDNYEKDTNFKVPNGSIKINGNTVQAASKVTFPDKQTTNEEYIKLSLSGDYSITYSVNVKNTSHEVIEKFTVGSEPLYSVTSKRSSFEYVESFGYGLDNISTGTVKGLKVALSSGDLFTFNQPINIKDATAIDKLLSLIITPSKLGEKDVNGFSIILTDAHDSDNFVKVMAKRDPTAKSTVIGNPATNQQRVYVTAGSAFQPQTGIEFEYTPPRLNVSNAFGTIQNNLSLFGTLNSKPLSENTFDFRFNNQERSIHISNPHYALDNRVSDLDDTYFYWDTWHGFTTDEVIVSVQGENYEKSHFNFVISNFVGSENLNSNILEDKLAPTILVELLNYENEIPIGIMGVSYNIFEAKALDSIDGSVPVNTKVYRNYYSSKVSVPITNNSFKPTAPTIHTIEYTSEDQYGNIAIRTFDVEVKLKSEIEFIFLNQIPNSVSLGTKLYLPEIEVNGGSGMLNVVITATNGKETIDLTNKQYHIFLSEGNWTINYKVTDYLGQVLEDNLTINVKKESYPVFQSEPELPKYLIAGKDNKINPFYANDYDGSNGDEVLTEVTYIDSTGTHKVTNNIINPTVNTTGDTIKIIYTVKKNGHENSIEYDVKTIKTTSNNDVDNISDWFYSDNGVVTTTKSEGAVLSNNGINSSVEYVNSIISGAVIFQFSIDKTKNNSRLKYTLTDSINNDIQTSVILSNNDSNLSTNAEVNGTLYSIYSATFHNGGKYNIGYETTTRSLLLDDNVSAPIFFDDNGEKFEGFPSGKVFASIEFMDNAETEIVVYSISSQSFDVNRVDNAPLFYSGHLNTIYEQGSSITLFPAHASDVLDPSIYFTVTVTNPDGTIAKDINGVNIEDLNGYELYKIKLEQFGRYNVNYTISDLSGNTTSFRNSGYILQSVDLVSPVIVVNGEIVSEAILGSTVYIPKATATDNHTKDLKVDIILTTSQGLMITMEEENDGFIAMEVGVYTITYVATDESGNRTTIDYKVVVSKEKK